MVSSKTYTTTSSSNTITKTLLFVSDIELKFKDEVNIYNPEIIIKYSTEIDFNYLYIEKFKRYYFVEEVVVFPNNIFKIGLKCDVLMSFKTDILASSGNITSQTNYNNFYNYNYSSEVRRETEIFYSKTIITSAKNTILCTIGGM